MHIWPGCSTTCTICIIPNQADVVKAGLVMISTVHQGLMLGHHLLSLQWFYKLEMEVENGLKYSIFICPIAAISAE